HRRRSAAGRSDGPLRLHQAVVWNAEGLQSTRQEVLHHIQLVQHLHMGRASQYHGELALSVLKPCLNASRRGRLAHAGASMLACALSENLVNDEAAIDASVCRLYYIENDRSQ